MASQRLKSGPLSGSIGNDVSPHVLRHSAACAMVEAGVPMEAVAQFLGHSNASVTFRVYARYSPTYLQGAAKALEKG